MPTIHISPGILFVSERCNYCVDLLSKCDGFRPDLTLNIVSVDNADKKTTKLMEAYSVEGVPTLVVDNEKHSEGEAVFATLLKRKRISRPPSSSSKSNIRDTDVHHHETRLATVPESTTLDFADGCMDVGTPLDLNLGTPSNMDAPLDFETPECSREARGDSASQLDIRLREIEDMRKQSDDNAKKMNQTLSDRKMMTTRQMDYDGE
jgi:hypothetical protein